MLKYVTCCTLNTAFKMFFVIIVLAVIMNLIVYADMVKLVDTLVSGISDESHAGSSPVIRIFFYFQLTVNFL